MLLDLRVCFETIKEYEYKKSNKKIILTFSWIKIV